jgi:hypothetical protein
LLRLEAKAASRYHFNMQTAGRFMQIFALVLLPASVVLQLMGQLSPSQLLVGLVFGAALFYLGRMLEGIARADADKFKQKRDE